MIAARWPKMLLCGAVSLALLHGAVTLGGGARYVSFLCGARPAGYGELLLGLAYVVTYFAEVVLAPMLALAGVMGLVWSGVLTPPRRARPGPMPVTSG